MRLQPLNRFGRGGVFQQPANSLTLFLLLSVVGLLCLMPVWYYFLAPWLAEPVLFLAGKLV